MNGNEFVECPADAEEIELGMSNFDHTTDPGFEDALRAAPGKVWGRHSAWNFNGTVWFDGKLFYEQVWRHHSHVTTMCAETLEQLMSDVNDEYGAE